ncbi:MAG: response regulator [Opitutaceae bacterium]|nr:response regulator [Opitutaceae bacterium]
MPDDPTLAYLRLRVCRWLLCCLTVVATGAARAQISPDAAPTEPAVVRDYEQFWTMSGDQHQLAHAVDLVGDVIHVDPDWKMIFVKLGAWCHYLGTDGMRVDLRAGQRVRVTGTVVPARGPQPGDVRIEVIGETPPTDYPDLFDLTDADRMHPMAVVGRGLVNRQDLTDETHLYLEIAYRSSTYTMRIYLAPGSPVPDLVGSYVQARGLYNPMPSGSRGVWNFEFLVPGAAWVERVGSLEGDPAFARPATPIGELGQASDAAEVRVVGEVRAQAPGRSITLRDATGQVEVLTGQTAPAALGRTYEAVGLPRRDGVRLVLHDGRYRAADPAARPVFRAGLATLRLVDQVLALPREVAEKGGPVQLSGAVAWSYPEIRHFFLVDATGGVRVTLPDGADVPPPGSSVSVAGATAFGDFAPGVAARRVDLLGLINLPEARDISFEQAMTGMEDAQWVALRGLVRAADDDGPWTRLDLSTTGGELAVYAPRDPVYRTRVGAIVRARGICAAQANARLQLTGVRLWLRGPGDLQVEEPAPADPFAPDAVRAVSLAGLRQFSTLQTANRRIKLSGTVTHHVPGRFFYMQDSADAIQVLARGGIRLDPGDRVEVVGLPGSDTMRLVLREAEYRRLETGREPVPVRIDEHLTPDTAYENRLVRLHARVLETMSSGQDSRLVLESGGVVFAARLGSDEAGTPVVEPQSRVELTGIYSVVFDEYRRPRAFVLQLRRSSDLDLIEAPPWFNARTAARLMGVAVLVLLLGLGWVMSLRRRVKRQTDQIREQLASEAELKARQRDILENANDCIFTTDLGGRITAFNRAGERLTGYTRDEAMQLHLRDLFAGAEDAARALAQLRVEQGDGVSFETRFRTRDGGLVWVEVSSRLLVVDGRPAGLLGIVHDMTERRKFEDELAAARDAAQASAAAKSSFLANMSHEIRTPMNGVIGMANLLIDTPLAREQREFAETIRDSAESLLTILNDILDFSKIEAGKLRFDPVPFDLLATVDGTLDLLASRAAARQLALAADVPRAVPSHLVGDPGRLRQVLLNLVGNAIKFTETGEVLVQVACVARSPGHALLRFEVVDSGPGLSEEAQARLFQPFEQADSSTTRRFGGTGLGLAISRQIVGMMDGEIGVRSRPGEGATFWFTARFGCEESPAGESPAVTLRDGRVLVVEANAAVRRILAGHLAAWDASVVTAASAEEALASTRVAADDRRAFDLAIVDHDTLGSAGFVPFCAALRALPGAGHIRVLGLVPVDRRSDLATAQGPGFAGLLPKPVRRDSLIDAARQALAGAEILGLASSPAVAAESDAMTPSIAPAALDSRPPGSATTPLVLVVEDNIVNQRVARLLLGKLGVRIDLAGNGLEALAALERASYAAVFMDCQMPEMDGYQATARIRADGRFEGLRIIAMTANAMEGDRKRCLEAGMDDYVSKPMRPDELRAALERAEVLDPSPPES